MSQQKEVYHSLNYRPDIDGLRGISIILVLLSHTLGITAGNIGVEIFFALSGYLITTILLKEHKQGTYSLKKFYARRVKRIFPVLYISTAVFLYLAYV